MNLPQTRTPKPKPGTDVHLVLLEYGAYRNAKPTWVLDGTVIDTFWWEKQDPQVFCLLVPGDEVPERVIRMADVVSINGELVRGWDEVSSNIRTWEVESNSGPGTYVVSFDGQDWKCECKGFAYHRHCSHIQKIQRELECRT